MEVISNIIQTTLESFDFAFCIIVNILTYLLIGVISTRKGKKDLTTWQKRIVLVIVILVLGILYWYSGADIKTLANSAILAPVFWSWVFKPVCKAFNIDYKQISLFD